jgi:type I restriction enzyme R subunit
MSLNEADTRAKLIDPALHNRGWTEDLIKREETAGAVELVGNRPRRRRAGRIDYVLRIQVNIHTQPVAVALIEAKAEDLPPHHGLEQAKGYAACKRLNVAFVFSSNGHQFVAFDRSTGMTTTAAPMAEFPSPEILRTRYEQQAGFKLSDPAAKPLLVPYHNGEATRRYYQDAAIRAVFEKIAHCEHTGEPKRALLSLATGAGKTYIAVHLLKRIADAGQLHRALFVCDRDELRSQALGALQNVFGSNAAAASAGNPQKNARVLVATYQTLDVDNEDATANFLTQNYPENYFSHIIIDECHRSAWGKWSQILTRNPDAVQIGLTATPRSIKLPESAGSEIARDAQINADNLKYFGDPVYEYEMGQGIEDGYLALCEIQKGRVNLDSTGITIEQIIARNPVNAITGEPVSAEDIRAMYLATDYERQIMLPDRVLAMCQDLCNYLSETGGLEQKTIIFCATDYHAAAVAAMMNNLYAVDCKQEARQRVEPYAFRCTASVGGSDFIADFRGSSRTHFIATTVDLLSTGVDVPSCRNIVFFKYVKSPISFYQMIGRGTRIDEVSGKLMFRVYDYTNATRLFGEEFITRHQPPRKESTGDAEPPPPIIVVEGFDVHVTEAGRYILANVDGKATPVTIEEYKQILAAKVLAEAPTLEKFRERWVEPESRNDLLTHLPEAGRSATLIQSLEMNEYDLFDVLGGLTYGLNPLTRERRALAFTYKNEQWLAEFPANAAATLKAVAAQFSRGGTEELENKQIFFVPEVHKPGGLAALQAVGDPQTIMNDTKVRLFAA